MLPTCYEVPFTFSEHSKQPLVSGKFSDLWKLTGGERQNQSFAVKSFRVHKRLLSGDIDEVRCGQTPVRLDPRADWCPFV